MALVWSAPRPVFDSDYGGHNCHLTRPHHQRMLGDRRVKRSSQLQMARQWDSNVQQRKHCWLGPRRDNPFVGSVACSFLVYSDGFHLINSYIKAPNAAAHLTRSDERQALVFSHNRKYHQ